MAANLSKWKFQFRQDQCEFIVAAMEYISKRADYSVSNSSDPFKTFSALRTKERAQEIAAEISQVIG